MIIYIENNVPYHYEIIETIIYKFLKKNKNTIFKLNIVPNNIFSNYLKNKYNNIEFLKRKIYNFDIYFNCTIYPIDFKKVKKNSNKYFYICHTITPIFNHYKNVFYLTPLSKNYIQPNILPFMENEKIKTKIPIYVIQGNFIDKRRNFNLLRILLNQKFKYDFKIKMVGRGDPPLNHEKIILKKNLNFTDFHKEFLDIYCILPLISKKTHPQYYKNKLTSSMSYTYAYNLNIILDQDLQDIYKHKKAFVYNNEKDFLNVFEKSLVHFYENKN